jgi:predicted DNA-binding protein YlxM (UPF0122 family)
MECYGQKYGRKDQCANCELAPWCKDAGDPAPTVAADVSDYRVAAPSREPVRTDDSPAYTYGQMAEIIRLLVFLDDSRIRQILQWKFEDPDISLSEIGRRYRITKQAVRKDIKLAIKYCPSLATILCNRPLFNRWRQKNRYTPERIPRRKPEQDHRMKQLEFKF